MKKEYYICLLILMALLPVLIFRDFTPSNELRYLSIADEALREGHFFAFTNHGFPYADKPPLYLWIVMLGKTLFGSHQMWFLSLFSLLPAFGCALLMDKWAKDVLSPAYRFTSLWMLMSCGMFLGTAVVLRMDMLMCWFILLSLYTFYKMYHEGIVANGKEHWLFPLYIFLALFTKGPLGFLVPFCSTLAFLIFHKKYKMISVFWGWRTWLVLLAGCSVWFGMVYQEGGNAYLQNLLVHQTVGRAVNAFIHSKPFYYYLYSVWYCMMPWSLLVGGAILVSSFKGKLWKDDLSRFFLTIIGCTFIILSLISSKIEIYLIPAYPFIIYLGIISLQRLKRTPWMAGAIALPALAFALALPAFCVLVFMTGLGYLGHMPFYVAVAVLTLTGTFSLYHLFRYHSLSKVLRWMSMGLFIALFAGGWGVPAINDHLGYGTLCNRSTEIATRYKLDNFSVWRLSRPENMDVYLHHEVEILPSDKPLPADLSNTVLILPQKEAKKITRYKERHQVGDNVIVVL